MKNYSIYLPAFLLIAIGMFWSCKTDSGANQAQTDTGDQVEETTTTEDQKRDLLYVVHEVENYESWKKGFDEHEPARQEAGLKTIGVARNMNNPNMIHLSFFVGDYEKASEFVNSEELKTKMQELGVTGPPQMYFMNEINISSDPSPGNERIFVMHEVKDYNTWKQVYDGNADNRANKGLTERAILTDRDNPNKISLVFHYSDKEALDEYLASDDLKRVMKGAGVVGESDMQFMSYEQLALD